MRELGKTMATVLAGRYSANLFRIRDLATPLSEKQFWGKPYSYGNSFGHLVLHLTGNLNYYIGAEIAKTGYVRDRAREFSEPDPPSKEVALQSLHEAVTMVIATLGTQSPESWSEEYRAVGTECASRLDIFLQCASHMRHHIGQMIYIRNEWQRQNQATWTERSVT